MTSRTPEAYAATHGRVRPAGGAGSPQVLPLQRQPRRRWARASTATIAIGTGELGLAPFGFFLNDPRFAATPMILETPKSEDMHEDVENLALLRGLIQG